MEQQAEFRFGYREAGSDSVMDLYTSTVEASSQIEAREKALIELERKTQKNGRKKHYKLVMVFPPV